MSQLSKKEIEQAKKLFNMSKLSQIMENIREVIARDKKQKQPLILRINEGFIFNITRKAILEKNSTFVMAIAGESASGKTTLVKNAAKACVKSDTDDVYTVICCDDYYKDASRELSEAGSYEKLFETGFSFDTPESKKDSVLKKPAKLVLNEGLYVLHEDVRDIADVKIYVYTPFEVIKDRWFARAASRGKTGNAAQMQFHDVNQTAFRHIRPTMDIADVVINGMTTQEYIEKFVNELIHAIVSVIKDKNISL